MQPAVYFITLGLSLMSAYLSISVSLFTRVKEQLANILYYNLKCGM